MIGSIPISAIFSEIKRSITLAIPLIITKIVYDLSGFCATIMVEELGSKTLAAYALMWETFAAFIAFFIGVLTITNIFIAHNFGANNISSIKVYFNQGLWLAIIFSPITAFRKVSLS